MSDEYHNYSLCDDCIKKLPYDPECRTSFEIKCCVCGERPKALSEASVNPADLKARFVFPKFDRYDLVQLCDRTKAIVWSSDKDRAPICEGATIHGNPPRVGYSLLLEAEGVVSWFREEDLTLIEPAQKDLAREWILNRRIRG